MEHVLHFIALFIEALFFVGAIGSTIVIILTTGGDLKVLFEKDELNTENPIPRPEKE